MRVLWSYSAKGVPRCPQWALLILTVIAVHGCDSPSGDPLPEERPPSPYYIALGGREEPRLIVLRSDGTDEARIPCPGFDSRAVDPNWSRNGAKLSVGCIRDTLAVLYTVNRDGTDLREVASMPRFQTGEGKGQHYVYPEFMEDWGPNGDLVYVRSTPSETSIEVLPADGTAPRTIHRRANVPTEMPIAYPRWNGPGTTIVFQRNRGLYAVDATGANLRPLVAEFETAGVVVVPGEYSISPNGTSVGFIAYSGDGSSALRSMDISAGSARTIYSSPSSHPIQSFCWSPAGTRLSLVTTYGSSTIPGSTETREEVKTVNPDGTAVRTEATGLSLMYSERKAAWTADGEKLIYVRIGSVPGDQTQQLYTYSLNDRTGTKIRDLPAILTFEVSGSRCAD